MTRGQRNFNPLNLRKGSNWKGLSKVQSDKEFCQFDSMVYGVRAAIITLRTYAYKYRCHSLKDVISRWAPASDGNNVDNYCYLIRSFFSVWFPHINVYHTISDDTLLNIWWSKDMPKLSVYYLLKAMAIIESNYVISKSVFDSALKLL